MIQSINKYEYKVHKFAGKLIPDVTYTVRLLPNGKMSCSCPSGAYRGYCKHTSYVKQYQELEKKSDTIPILTIPY